MLFGLTACTRQLQRIEFLREYEKQVAVVSETGNYRFISMYESSEYLAAEQGDSLFDAVEMDSLKHQYGNGIYVRLSIRAKIDQRDLDTSSWQPKDPVLIQALLAQRLQQFQGAVATKVSLQGPGNRVLHPISSTFHGGLRTGTANAFLIVFPLLEKGEMMDPNKWHLMIEDFGLNTETIRQRLVLPQGIRLKVAA